MSVAEGLRHGFRIGFHHGKARLKPHRKNYPSCHSKPSVVSEKIKAEVLAGRLLGPVTPNLRPVVHMSPMGLVPKPHQLVDLSSPGDNSVDAVTMVKTLGRGNMLVKIDLKGPGTPFWPVVCSKNFHCFCGLPSSTWNNQPISSIISTIFYFWVLPFQIRQPEPWKPLAYAWCPHFWTSYFSYFPWHYNRYPHL